jgi:hypothetical protein
MQERVGSQTFQVSIGADFAVFDQGRLFRCLIASTG